MPNRILIIDRLEKKQQCRTNVIVEHGTGMCQSSREQSDQMAATMASVTQQPTSLFLFAPLINLKQRL